MILIKRYTKKQYSTKKNLIQRQNLIWFTKKNVVSNEHQIPSRNPFQKTMEFQENLGNLF
jgi:hypothetical protein